MSSTSSSEILLEHLRRQLSEAGLASTDLLGIGYSGGRDSTTLLWALTRIHPLDKLLALHIDHGWRPLGEREEEKALVEKNCRDWGVKVLFFGPPPSEIRLQDGPEANARKFRYECFENAFQDKGLKKILLAQHAADQAETVLMRLLQGRSWLGLGGIPKTRGNFLRPLIDLDVETIWQVAREEALPFWTDSTNADQRPLRNYLRQAVLAPIKKRFPTAERALLETAREWRNRFRDRLDPGWRIEDTRASISARTWFSWSRVGRGNQLLLAAKGWFPGKRIARRFLETLVSSQKKKGVVGEGSRLRLSFEAGDVVWEVFREEKSLGIFVKAEESKVYDLTGYTLQFLRLRSSDQDLFFPGMHFDSPLIWKTPLEGENFLLNEGFSRGKTWRRHRRGTDHSDNIVYVYQEGFLRAVVNPLQNTLIWAQKTESNLKFPGIFVKLVPRRHS